MSILLYAFSNQWGTNISRRTLLELQKNFPVPADFQLIYFHPKTFFQKYIARHQYDLIIGLGDFFGNISKIRLETVARNVYGSSPIYPFAPITLELSLPALDNFDTHIFDISENMGIYNCNWIAYSIERHLQDRHLPARQLFLHLPKKMPASLAAAQILEMLANNRLLETQ